MTEHNEGSPTHDVGLEVLVKVQRVDGLLDHGVDLVVADMNLAHSEMCRVGRRLGMGRGRSRGCNQWGGMGCPAKTKREKRRKAATLSSAGALFMACLSALSACVSQRQSRISRRPSRASDTGRPEQGQPSHGSSQATQTCKHVAVPHPLRHRTEVSRVGDMAAGAFHLPSTSPPSLPSPHFISLGKWLLQDCGSAASQRLHRLWLRQHALVIEPLRSLISMACIRASNRLLCLDFAHEQKQQKTSDPDILPSSPKKTTSPHHSFIHNCWRCDFGS